MVDACLLFPCLTPGKTRILEARMSHSRKVMRVQVQGGAVRSSYVRAPAHAYGQCWYVQSGRAGTDRHGPAASGMLGVCCCCLRNTLLRTALRPTRA